MSPIKKFNEVGSSGELVLKFSNPAAARLFKSWLCNRGEQDYWHWQEEAERNEEGPVSGVSFDYWTGDNTIPVECGRLCQED